MTASNHQHSFLFRIGYALGSNAAFNIATQMLHELSRSSDWDWDAIYGACARWQRCCPDQRRTMVRLLWMSAESAAEEGNDDQSHALATCARLLAVASARSREAYSSR